MSATIHLFALAQITDMIRSWTHVTQKLWHMMKILHSLVSYQAIVLCYFDSYRQMKMFS